MAIEDPTRSAALTPERADLALWAALEIESIAGALRRDFQRTEAEHMFALGLTIRLETLAGIVISAVGDKREDAGPAPLPA